jgi:MFS family permease
MKKNKVRKNLNLSTVEGTFWAIMYGAGESYISALAVFLNFSAFQISFLNSFPQFIGSCFQLLSSIIKNQFKSIRRFVAIISLIQSFMWLLIIFCILYFPNYTIILLWTCLYFSIASVIGPAWTAWMGYFVPTRLRARYFGKRNRIIGFASFISTFIAGYILDIFESNMINGFIIIFTIAFLGRLISAFYLNKKYDFDDNENINLLKYLYSFKNMVADKNKSFYYIIFNSYISFSIMFFGPLFSIYILREMELGVIIYTINMTLWQIANFSTSNFFGKLCERIGDYKVLSLSTYTIVLLPILWILLYYLNGYYQIIATCVVSLLAGVCFSAYSLSSFNMIYKISKKEEVIHFTAVGAFLRGFAILMGGILAGLIVESNYVYSVTKNLNLIPIHLSMIISVLLRFLSIPILKKIK